jgi:hypothetical protein
MEDRTNFFCKVNLIVRQYIKIPYVKKICYFENPNERSGSIKARSFMESRAIVCQKGLCSLKFVRANIKKNYMYSQTGCNISK